MCTTIQDYCNSFADLAGGEYFMVSGMAARHHQAAVQGADLSQVHERVLTIGREDGNRPRAPHCAGLVLKKSTKWAKQSAAARPGRAIGRRYRHSLTIGVSLTGDDREECFRIEIKGQRFFLHTTEVADLQHKINGAMTDWIGAAVFALLPK